MPPFYLLLAFAVVLSRFVPADDTSAPPRAERRGALDAVRALAKLKSDDQAPAADKNPQPPDDATPSRKQETAEQRTREQSELRKQQQEFQLREREVYSNLLRLVRSLGSRDDERAKDAADELLAIRDPHAIRPLVFAMHDCDEALRCRLLEVIASIRDTNATAALAFVAVVDDSADVRQLALDLLKERREERAYSNLVLADALASKQIGLIYNAADAAVELDEKVLVPELIASLCTPVRSNHIVEDRVPSPVMTRPPSGLARASNPAGKLEATSKSAANAGVKASPIRIIPNGGVRPYVPSYRLVHPWGIPTGQGGATPPANRTKQTGTIHINISGPNPFTIVPTQSRPSLRTIETIQRNEPVLTALRELTGKDFEFDAEAWIAWWEKEGRKIIGDRELPTPENKKQAVVTDDDGA